MIGTRELRLRRRIDELLDQVAVQRDEIDMLRDQLYRAGVLRKPTRSPSPGSAPAAGATTDRRDA